MVGQSNNEAFAKQFDHKMFEETAAAWQDVIRQSQALLNTYLEKGKSCGSNLELDPEKLDPLNIREPMNALAQVLSKNPKPLFETQANMWQEFTNLWMNTQQRMAGQNAEPLIQENKGDRRFKDPEWVQNPVFSFIKQSYLLLARAAMDLVLKADGLDEKNKKRALFYTKQWVDALSPNNFFLTNPEILRTTMQESGQNLLRGLKNLLSDLEKGHGQLSITMTDNQAFEVGKNVATTPGKVVYRNDLIELIHYAPTTDQVFQVPMMIIPPWINKYYIMDLRPDNSMVKWLVDQGFSVFLMSWFNPNKPEFAKKSFEDYLEQGPLDAIKVIQTITKSDQVHATGYCLGGTLLACLVAYLAKTTKAKQTNPIASATYLASMVDFSEPGDLGVFIDEVQLKSLEDRMKSKGYLDAQAMATTFNMLRSNDLIWNFVIQQYWLGKDPVPFDLLFWNSDSTAMPAAMHMFYLRRMYMDNALIQPNAINLLGVPLDLGKIKNPSYLVATHDDHIAPWKSTYAPTQIYQGPIRFVLAGSGHIAGIINPPAARKYQYWTNENLPQDPALWFQRASEQAGSWWDDWKAWLTPLSGPRVKSETPGKGPHKALMDAPGSYVRAKAS